MSLQHTHTHESTTYTHTWVYNIHTHMSLCIWSKQRLNNISRASAPKNKKMDKTKKKTPKKIIEDLKRKCAQKNKEWTKVFTRKKSYWEKISKHRTWEAVPRRRNKWIKLSHTQNHYTKKNIKTKQADTKILADGALLQQSLNHDSFLLGCLPFPSPFPTPSSPSLFLLPILPRTYVLLPSYSLCAQVVSR